jgi:hypothetical protein
MTSDTWGDHLDPAAEPPADRLPAGEQQVVDAVRERLRDEALWSGPPAGLRDTLLAAAAAEQAATRPPGTEPAGVEPVSTEPARTGPAGTEPSGTGPGGRPRRRVLWLVAAAAAVAIGAGTVALWPQPERPAFTVAGTLLAPRAKATVTLEEKSAGVAIRLQITGLQPAPPGTYYAAWLRGPVGVVPVGTFHWHKGGIPIDLWSGVTTEHYSELFVTLQQEGAPPEPSDQVVLTGRTR